MLEARKEQPTKHCGKKTARIPLFRLQNGISSSAAEAHSCDDAVLFCTTSDISFFPLTIWKMDCDCSLDRLGICEIMPDTICTSLTVLSSEAAVYCASFIPSPTC